MLQKISYNFLSLGAQYYCLFNNDSNAFYLERTTLHRHSLGTKRDYAGKKSFFFPFPREITISLKYVKITLDTDPKINILSHQNNYYVERSSMMMML